MFKIIEILSDLLKQMEGFAATIRRMVFRVLAYTLAFLVSFDLLFCDGRYSAAGKQIALTILQHF